MPAKPAKRAGAVSYSIRPADPKAHLFEVALEVAAPDPAGQIFTMPVWIPGSYLVREFGRNVVSIEAQAAARGAVGARTVPIRKIDKHRWQAAPCDGPLRLRYLVYAWDLSVRSAHLDATHGFFNGTSVFLRADGFEHAPCTVRIEAPPGAEYRDWQVATTLPGDGAPAWGFGQYRASDYDELVDHPVEMGTFARISFEVGGAVHDVAVTGRSDVDLARVAKDLRAVCAAQIALFEPSSRRAPVRRYLFLVMAVGDGYGGLEHRASTALICKRSDLPYVGMKDVPDGYRSFLGLCSHEYFHTWHVKRIKPAAFANYDLERENHTRLLWVFEGFTSYYDDLMLARSGVIDEPAYLKLLAGTISGVLRGPGRRLQSVAESSFDAWTRYYRQDENSPNAIVSYYAKGALVAMCLDLTIRARTNGKHSLDDVMRLMWRRYGHDFYERDGAGRSGVAEEEMPSLIAEATGLNLRRQIAAWAESTVELPLAALLRPFGLTLELKAAEGAAAELGVRLAIREGALVVTHVLSDGPAHTAGLAAGDTLVAADGLRVADERSLQGLLERRAKGSSLHLHLFRRDELYETNLVRAQAPATEPSIADSKQRSTAMKALRTGWLGKPKDRVRYPKKTGVRAA